MRVSSTSRADSKNFGSSDKVRKPWAMGAPKGPCFARSTSMWIHWWSPVASAKRFTCCWVTVIQSLTATSSPTHAARSESFWKVRIPRNVARHAAAWRRLRVEPAGNALPLLQVALHLAGRQVEQGQAARGQVHVVLRGPQEAEHGQAQVVDELLQLVRGDRALV